MKRIELVVGEFVGDSGVEFVREIEKGNRGRRRIIGKCRCGKEFPILLESLRGKNPTKSCGCLMIEKSREVNTVHGFGARGRNDRLYQKWSHMKGRCLNKNNPRYNDWGGRGITICDEWKDSFVNFKDWALDNGYSETLQIDRIDNDKGYSPDNCRFVGRSENTRNRRVKKDNKTGVSGVAYLKDKGKYRVTINHVEGKRKSLGHYFDFFEAVCARKSAEDRYWTE